jgi:hypothetical protein
LRVTVTVTSYFLKNAKVTVTVTSYFVKVTEISVTLSVTPVTSGKTALCRN